MSDESGEAVEKIRQAAAFDDHFARQDSDLIGRDAERIKGKGRRLAKLDAANDATIDSAQIARRSLNLARWALLVAVIGVGLGVAALLWR